MDSTRRSRLFIDIVLCILIGLAAVALASVLSGMSKAAVVVGLVAMAALPVALYTWVLNERLATVLLIVGLAFSIPLNLDFNLFYRHHVGAAPSITVNITLILLGVFFLMWWYRYTVGIQRYFVRFYPPLMWAAFLLLALTPLSLVNATHPDLVALEWIRLVCLILAMVAMMSLQDEKLMRIWVVVLSSQVFIQACLAGAQYALKRNLGLGMFGEEALVSQNIGYIATRATGTVGHPNVLSYFFEITVPIMLALALTRQPGRWQLWFALVFVAGIAGDLTTLSRGSWITLPFSLGIVFIFVYGHKIVRARSAFIGLLIGCVLFVAFYFAFPVIEKRFTHTDYKSSASRKPLNIASISIIEQFPVLGVGLNNFAEVFKRYDKTGKSRIFHGYHHVVHNLHLWILTEVGVVGFLAYMAPFFVTFWIAWKVAPRAPPLPRALLIGIAAGLLAHLAHGMVDPGFRVSLTVSFLIFMLMGLAGAIALRYQVKPVGHGVERE